MNNNQILHKTSLTAEQKEQLIDILVDKMCDCMDIGDLLCYFAEGQTDYLNALSEDEFNAELPIYIEEHNIDMSKLK